MRPLHFLFGYGKFESTFNVIFDMHVMFQMQIKYGGPGRAKQTCMMRQCLQPMLPVTAQCVYCNLDGWRQQPVSSPQAKQQITNDLGPSALMECSVCYEIAHSDCAQKAIGPDQKLSGVVNEDLPNSWECLRCCVSGKNTDYKVRECLLPQQSKPMIINLIDSRCLQPRHFRARQKSSDIRRMSVSSDASSAVEQKNAVTATANNMPGDANNRPNSDHNHHHRDHADAKPKSRKKQSSISPDNAIKIENPLDDSQDADESVMTSSSSGRHELNIKRRKSEDGSICSSQPDGPADAATVDNHNSLARRKMVQRTQLANQILASSTKSLKKPTHVVRPANFSVSTTNGGINHYALDSTALLAVFHYLPHETLITCSLVCKTWSTVSVDPKLWRRMNCGHHKLSAGLLMAIVRRQPEHLILDWTSLAKRQLSWLIARLPALKNLSIQGTQISSVLGLHTCLCPPLQVLDLSFVRSLNDSAVRDILSPPKDSRPGLTDSKSRLRNLKVFKLAGTDISDVALRYITQGLPSLIHLNISSCQRVTDAGVAQIGTCTSAINTLVELDLSSCKLVTEICLEYLAKCDALTYLDLRHVPQVSTQAVIKFAAKSKHNLHVRDIKLVDKRK